MLNNWTDRARKVYKLATEEAAALGDTHIGTEHLLLAILRENTNVAGKVLGSRGITYDNVKEKILDLLGKSV